MDLAARAIGYFAIVCAFVMLLVIGMLALGTAMAKRAARARVGLQPVVASRAHPRPSSQPDEEDASDHSGMGSLDAESIKRLMSHLRVRRVPGRSPREVVENLVASL